MKNEKGKKKHGCLTAIIVVVVLFVLVGIFGGKGDSNEAKETTAPSESVTETVVASTDAAASEATETEAEAKADDVSKEYKSALKKAESYSATMNMSKAGIYDQLTSEYGEQFPEDAAQYAIDNMTADWNANALAKAKSYSDTMHMSKAGIYDQLVSDAGEKFTADEAQYAVDNLE